MKTKSAISLLGWLWVAGYALAGSVPTISLHVRVIDLDGEPVENASVGIGGGLDTPDDAPRTANGATNREGTFSAIIGSNQGAVSAFARAPHFYQTTISGLRIDKGDDGIREAHRLGRWEPWEQSITIVLKPIKKPIPLYAKEIEALVPAVGAPVGYDLEKGDWVAPYGVGVRTDFVFTTVGQYESAVNYEGQLLLCFPGQGDGAVAFDSDPAQWNPEQYSELRMPYEAPESGYGPRLAWRNARTTDTQSRRDAPSVFVDESNLHVGFFFRIRTVLDAQGKVLSANYGKIYGPVSSRTFEGGKCRIRLTYYLNPTPLDRNLEYDTSKNLLGCPMNARGRPVKGLLPP